MDALTAVCRPIAFVLNGRMSLIAPLARSCWSECHLPQCCMQGPRSAAPASNSSRKAWCYTFHQEPSCGEKLFSRRFAMAAAIERMFGRPKNFSQDRGYDRLFIAGLRGCLCGLEPRTRLRKNCNRRIGFALAHISSLPCFSGGFAASHIP